MPFFSHLWGRSSRWMVCSSLSQAAARFVHVLLPNGYLAAVDPQAISTLGHSILALSPLRGFLVLARLGPRAAARG